MKVRGFVIPAGADDKRKRQDFEDKSALSTFLLLEQCDEDFSPGNMKYCKYVLFLDL